MALSVLSINVSKEMYGLFDSVSKSFIMTGTSRDMYKLKHEIEEAEQQENNKEYFENLIRNYIHMFSTIKHIDAAAKQSIEKKIAIFTRYLKEGS